MIVKFIEVTHETPGNYGKFQLSRWTEEEWARVSIVDETDTYLQHSLIGRCGWGPHHIWVLDIQTGEGACFSPGGNVHADLEKHRIWVCPMFEPFLSWLYRQDLTDLAKLPDLVKLTTEEAPFSMAGYRRPGPEL